jgi:hypothetical protein
MKADELVDGPITHEQCSAAAENAASDPLPKFGE